MSKPLDGRIAVVTGASRGIGRAAASPCPGRRPCGRAGAHAGRAGGARRRDPGRGRHGDAGALDLKDYDALDRLGAAIHERWGKLDILVGNAGVLGAMSPLGHVEPQGVGRRHGGQRHRQLAADPLVDPLLRASDAGRALFMSSGAAQRHCLLGPLSVSKAALEALARTYAAETVNTPVRVMLVNPGPLRTRMRASAMPGEDPETLRTPEDLAPNILRLASPDWQETGKLYDFPQDKVLSFRTAA